MPALVFVVGANAPAVAIRSLASATLKQGCIADDTHVGLLSFGGGCGATTSGAVTAFELGVGASRPTSALALPGHRSTSAMHEEARATVRAHQMQPVSEYCRGNHEDTLLGSAQRCSNGGNTELAVPWHLCRGAFAAALELMADDADSAATTPGPALKAANEARPRARHRARRRRLQQQQRGAAEALSLGLDLALCCCGTETRHTSVGTGAGASAGVGAGTDTSAAVGARQILLCLAGDCETGPLALRSHVGSNAGANGALAADIAQRALAAGALLDALVVDDARDGVVSPFALALEGDAGARAVRTSTSGVTTRIACTMCGADKGASVSSVLLAPPAETRSASAATSSGRAALSAVPVLSATALALASVIGRTLRRAIDTVVAEISSSDDDDEDPQYTSSGNEDS